MTTRIGNPFSLFVERNSLPISGGDCYIGTDGMDPELNPVSVYADAAMTVLVAQPIKIIGGHLCNDGNPAMFYVSADVYSIRVYGAAGNEVFYASHAVTLTTAYQPFDNDLEAIAALSTSAFGRGVLTKASAAALRSYAGIADSLALTGGTVTGNIVRSGAGSHLYHTDATFTSGRVFVTANGAADPTSQVGDIWLEQAP